MAEIVRYVDTDVVGGDGDGTSWANAYSSLSAWEAGEDTDLVSAGNTHKVYCRASSGGEDTAKCTLNTWTTDSTHFITIVGDRDSAAWDDTAYHMTVADGCFRVLVADIFWEGMQLHSTTASDKVISIDYAGSIGMGIKTSILRGSAETSQLGIYIGTTTSGGTLDVENTVIYGFSNGNGSHGIFARSAVTGADVSFKNVTVYDCYYGIRDFTDATITAVNCLVFGCTDDFAFTNGSADHCASDDGDGAFPTTITQSASTYAALVTDAAGGDFSVKDASSELYNAGTNTGAPATDFIGTSRPQATTVDIGAFEYVVAAGGLSIPNPFNRPFAGPIGGPF